MHSQIDNSCILAMNHAAAGFDTAPSQREMQVHQTFKDFKGEKKTFVCNVMHLQFAVSVADGEQKTCSWRMVLN